MSKIFRRPYSLKLIPVYTEIMKYIISFFLIIMPFSAQAAGAAQQAPEPQPSSDQILTALKTSLKEVFKTNTTMPLKSLYMQLARQCHPDKQDATQLFTEVFKAINNAYAFGTTAPNETEKPLYTQSSTVTQKDFMQLVYGLPEFKAHAPAPTPTPEQARQAEPWSPHNNPYGHNPEPAQQPEPEESYEEEDSETAQAYFEAAGEYLKAQKAAEKQRTQASNEYYDVKRRIEEEKRWALDEWRRKSHNANEDYRRKQAQWRKARDEGDYDKQTAQREYERAKEAADRELEEATREESERLKQLCKNVWEIRRPQMEAVTEKYEDLIDKATTQGAKDRLAYYRDQEHNDIRASCRLEEGKIKQTTRSSLDAIKEAADQKYKAQLAKAEAQLQAALREAADRVEAFRKKADEYTEDDIRQQFDTQWDELHKKYEAQLKAAEAAYDARWNAAYAAEAKAQAAYSARCRAADAAEEKRRRAKRPRQKVAEKPRRAESEKEKIDRILDQLIERQDQEALKAFYEILQSPEAKAALLKEIPEYSRNPAETSVIIREVQDRIPHHQRLPDAAIEDAYKPYLRDMRQATILALVEQQATPDGGELVVASQHHFTPEATPVLAREVENAGLNLKKYPNATLESGYWLITKSAFAGKRNHALGWGAALGLSSAGLWTLFARLDKKTKHLQSQLKALPSDNIDEAAQKKASSLNKKIRSIRRIKIAAIGVASLGTLGTLFTFWRAKNWHSQHKALSKRDILS